MTVSLKGDFGKPRPALVVQADHFAALPSVSVLPVTTTRIEAPLLRIDVVPNLRNGLTQPSQIMIDKIVTVRREKVGAAFGHAGDELMVAVNRALAVFLGIA